MVDLQLLQDVQKLDGDAPIFLYQLSKFSLDNPNEIFRFSNMAGVSFNGPYYAIACTHNAVEISNVGSQARLELTLSDAASVVTSLIDGNTDGLEGAELTIRQTRRRFLDDGETPSTSAILLQSTLIVSRVTSFVPGDRITVECSNPIDYSGEIGIPSRVCHQRCSWRYRGSECGFSGPEMYDLANRPVLDSSLDQCNKSLKACITRFGPNAVLSFGGFPVLQRR
jgi:lambda family phage minor tail protein L